MALDESSFDKKNKETTRQLMLSWLDIWARVSWGREYKAACHRHAVLKAGDGASDLAVMTEFEQTTDLVEAAKLKGQVRANINRIEQFLGINNAA